MASLQNILWKKENWKKSDSYIDIFDIKNHKISFKPVESMLIAHKPEPKNNRKSNAFREDGKTLYELKKYENAMKKFNYSLQLAEKGTEESGIAYANRSSCFFHLKMLEECLIDIDLARKSNYPKHLMHKLDAREAKCKEIMENSNQPEKIAVREPLLSFDEHKQFKGVANCLQIKYNHGFGRHVVTKSDLEIGKTILIERPYQIVGSENTNLGRDRCLHCFREGRNLVPCNTCISSNFCHDGCMEESVHKMSCNMAVPSIETFRFQLVFEMLYRIIIDFPKVDLLMKTVEHLLKGEEVYDLTTAQRDFCRIFQLAHHHDKLSDEAIDELLHQISIAFVIIIKRPQFKNKFSKGKYRTFLQHLILHIYHVADYAIELVQYFIKNEDGTMYDIGTQTYAKGMYPFACYINHSCTPNVYIFSIGDRLICKVIRPIKKGEQIFRCYM